MILTRVSLVWSLLACLFCSASPLCDYAPLAQKPPVIYQQEMEFGGDILRSTDKFTAKQLRDGRYGYLIVRDSAKNLHVIWGRQSQDPANTPLGKNYMSHLSQWNAATRAIFGELSVVAAGEVELVNGGMAAEFSNRSGKWPSENDRLDPSENLLKKMGIRFASPPGPSTLRVNYADPKAAKEDSERHHWQANIRAAKRNDYLTAKPLPGQLEGRQIEAALSYLRTRLYKARKLRSPTEFGFVDPEALFTDNLTVPEIRDASQLVIVMTMLQKDGPEFAVTGLLGRREQLECAFRAAEKLLNTKLTPPAEVPLE